jgi:hypothetical protein
MKAATFKIFALGSLLAAALSFSSCGSDEVVEDKPPVLEGAAPEAPAPAPVVEEPAPEPPVLFNDAKLEAAVRKALEKPVGPVTRKDLASLKKLQAVGMGITDLTGLEHATNLTRLLLAGNHVGDLTPLAGMTGLTALNLRQNQVSDVTPLANLTKLTELNLSANKITDDQKEMLRKALPDCPILF